MVADLRRAASSGIPRQISLSKRPARRRAGSRESGLLVAPMTRTWAVTVGLFRSVRREEPGTRHLICGDSLMGYNSYTSPRTSTGSTLVEKACISEAMCVSPSMQVSSWATILLSMSLEATSLLGVMASISSMNRIQGADDCTERERKAW